MSLEVKLKIEPRRAILARRTTVGIVTVQVTDNDLASLPDEILGDLAEVVESGEILEGPSVYDATFNSVLSGLSARRARREELVAETRRVEARTSEEEIVRKRQTEEAIAHHFAAITKWIETNCDEEMVERRKAGFLNDEEVIEEVMHQLFEIPEDEHVPIKAYQACDCDKGCTASVRAFVLPVTHLDSNQYSTLARIKESAPVGAEIIPQMRKSACPECACTPLVRMTALVRLPWNGWMLQKVYALG